MNNVQYYTTTNCIIWLVWAFTILQMQNKMNCATYIAFPSLNRTHDRVHSIVAPTIFLVVGLKVITSWCCVGSMLAYFRMLILVAATCLLLPLGETWNKLHKQQYHMHYLPYILRCTNDNLLWHHNTENISNTGFRLWPTFNYSKYSVFLSSLSWAQKLPQNIPADAGSLSNKAAVLGVIIKWWPCRAQNFGN